MHRSRPRSKPVLPTRFGRLLAAAFIGSALLPTPAAADPAKPTDFSSHILSIEPPLPEGFRLRVVGGDAFLELTVPTGHGAEVPDYDQGNGQEPGPYLRFAPGGEVSRDIAAAATTLNESRYGRSPGSGGPVRTTEWETVATGGRYAWHDHRIHWMLPSTPPAVDGRGRVQLDGPDGTWELPVVVEGTTHVVRGELLLLDPPPAPAWWTAVGAVALVTALVGGGGRGRHRAIAVGLGVLAVGAAATSWATWQAGPLGARASTLPIVISVAGLIAALVAGPTQNPRRRLVGLAGAAAALGAWGWGRRSVLQHAVLPTTLPPNLDRLVTMAAVGASLGAAVVLAWRPPRASRPVGTGGRAAPPPGP